MLSVQHLYSYMLYVIPALRVIICLICMFLTVMNLGVISQQYAQSGTCYGNLERFRLRASYFVVFYSPVFFTVSLSQID